MHFALAAFGLSHARHRRRRVVFRCEAPGASEVRFASDLTGWAKPLKMAQGQDGVWQIAVEMPAGRRVEYKFLVDGVWVHDSDARERTSEFGNSVTRAPD